MTVQCIACRHFNLRGAGQMARQGFGHCALRGSAAVFQSATFERLCPRFEAVDADTVAKRTTWLNWERRRFFEEILKHDQT
ncbi:hypothetical protein [Paracandidimonas lactea]|uniref:hypothetical protein n=1 Tax=Paracandidimonas lactea TaxID=2895524 RepID=UPI001F1D0BD9|nr:hypothetical protein [Paracandidimonas lactea]